MPFGLGSGDQRLDEPEGLSLDGLREAQWLLFVLYGPDHDVRPREPRESGGHVDGCKDGEAPGGDVGELDFVPAMALAPVQLLHLRDVSLPLGDGRFLGSDGLRSGCLGRPQA